MGKRVRAGMRMRMRVSSGSAARLGLKKMRVTCFPETIYLMTSGVCRAKCLFCSQWVGEDRLSRVQWPEYDLEEVVSRTKGERVCIQCLNYEGVFEDVMEIVCMFKGNPVSVSAQPFTEEEIHSLKGEVDRLSINMDCATPGLFNQMKPYYRWEHHLSKLLYARRVLGPFRASSHLIVGLGESEEDMVDIITFLRNHEISSSLFAFTPIRGTPLENMRKPSLSYYRRLQAAHYLLYQGKNLSCEKGRIVDLDQNVPPEAFTTRGCPGCNRPYYTETPRNIYNFPYTPGECEMEMIRSQLSRH